MDKQGIDLTNFSIDKSNWSKVKLGDVVAESRDTVKDFAAEQIEHVVGLEHIDSEDIHLRRSVSIEESTTFTKKFVSGDVLFGRRRAYLKKAAQATFSGICSGDITVMRVKDGLLPELLPFLIHNDKFFDYSVAHSAGSLSPRVKFKDLANYEFLLPPKDQQAKLAELLWAMDEMIELDFVTKTKNENLKNAIQRSYFDKDGIDQIIIDNCAKVYSGGTPNRKVSTYWGGDILWVKTAEVNYNEIYDTEEKITRLGMENSAAKLAPIGSVLLAMYGQGVTRGRVALTKIKVTCNQACAVIEPNEKFLSEYIYYFLEYKYKELRALAHGANQQNLNLKMIKYFSIPDCSLKAQQEIINKLYLVINAFKDIENKIKFSKSLQKSLINQIF